MAVAGPRLDDGEALGQAMFGSSRLLGRNSRESCRSRDSKPDDSAPLPERFRMHPRMLLCFGAADAPSSVKISLRNPGVRAKRRCGRVNEPVSLRRLSHCIAEGGYGFDRMDIPDR